MVGDLQKICQDIQEGSEQMTDSIDVTTAKLEVLQKMKYVEHMKNQLPTADTELDMSSKKVKLRGNSKDILTASKLVYDAINELVEKTVPMSPLTLKIIRSSEGWDYITDNMNANNLLSLIYCAVHSDRIIITGKKIKSAKLKIY